MITVFYPYWESGCEWNELRYSLRSLDKHLKTDFEVFIVGDLPPWVQNVTHIPYERDDFATNPSLYNALRMLELFLKTASELHLPDEFIRMYDDIYFLQDRTLDDLKVTRVIRNSDETMNLRSGGGVWRDQVSRTVNRVREMGYPGYMTESHCPEVFSIRKMEDLFCFFGLPENEYLTSTLYYNVHPFDHVIYDRKTERALFYGEENEFSFSSDDVVKKCKGKYYLNHSDSGLNSELRSFIRRRFRGKSRFER